MLALHYIVTFLMTYIVVFILFEMPKKKKVWYINVFIVVALLVIELLMGTYELHYALLPFIYDVVYTVLVIAVVIYSTFSIKTIVVTVLSQLFVPVVIGLGAGILFEIFGLDDYMIIMSPRYSLTGGAAGLILFICLIPAFKLINFYKMRLRIRSIVLLCVIFISYGNFVAWNFTRNRALTDFASRPVLNTIAFLGGILPIIGLVIFVLRENKLKEQDYLIKIGEYKQQEMVKNLKNQKDHYEQLHKKDLATKMYRHDTKRQLLIVLNFVKKGNICESEKLIESMVGKIVEIDNLAVGFTGSDFVDAGLSYLLQESEYQNVKLNTNWIIPSNLVIDPTEITSLFMNLLSNAFEAAVKCDESNQVINVEVTSQHNFLKIVIENSYDGILNLNGDTFMTRKEDKELHGFGVLSIKGIVAKYKGRITFKYEGKKFRVTITFGGEIYEKIDDN